MAREIVTLILRTVDHIHDILQITSTRPPRGRTTRKEWAHLPHPEWLPAQLRQYDAEINGHTVEWQSPVGVSGRPACQGGFTLLPLKAICGDWRETTYFGFPEENPRLAHYKIVDFLTAEASVGFYHDAAQDPGLYYHEHGEGTDPYPLHLDLLGYLRLLRLSLGCRYWQLLVLALLPNDGRNPAYRTDPAFLAGIRQKLEAWNPEFDYAAFVALYQQVRLPAYVPSAVPALPGA